MHIKSKFFNNFKYASENFKIKKVLSLEKVKNNKFFQAEIGIFKKF